MSIEPLVVIPNYCTEEDDLKVLFDGIMSVHRTAPGQTKILVVDDCSPKPELVDEIEAMQQGLDFQLIRREKNEGFCSPPDELILTSEDGYVALADLDPGVHG